MSNPETNLRRPFDFSRHPVPKPEVRRAILASWALDRSAVARGPAGLKKTAAVGDVLAPLKSLDGSAIWRRDHS